MGSLPTSTTLQKLSLALLVFTGYLVGVCLADMALARNVVLTNTALDF